MPPPPDSTRSHLAPPAGPVGDDGTHTDGGPVPTAGPVVAPPGFAVQAEVGRGGMGVVYRATQDGLNRPVALKMTLGPADPKGLVRFLAEAEAVAVRQRSPSEPIRRDTRMSA